MYESLKRAFDLLIAAVLLGVLWPLLAAIAVAIRLGSRGPALFRQERAGREGRPFSLYKFRTMRLDTDPFGPSPRSGEDPRLTRLGRFLREHSLDELPQLLNIVKGDMSLVGPRPLYVSQVPEWNERQKTRLLVKPGLTGLAQISGRGNLTLEEKLELDVTYVEQASLWLDIRICLATAARGFARGGVYEKRYSQAESTRGDTAFRRAEHSERQLQ
ncbi:MAG: sugar transferase [Sedimentisphaerales bacterium]|nr:sugar transferase [Sedimentisphaerales bacterium]